MFEQQILIKVPKFNIEKAEEQILGRQKQIDYFISEYTIGFLAEQMNKEEYFIPEYQRNFTWEDRRKQRFIESIILGLPIPFLFFYEDAKSGKLEIVDGVQRLCTIRDFIHGDLELDDLERLPELDGARFVDLPESRQRKIKNRSIRGIVLSEQADEGARKDLFNRINTGSKIANQAEIRKGSLGGPFIAMVNNLAKDSLFIELTPMSEKKIKEQEREELITRFFAYGDGLDDYCDEASNFLYSYVVGMNEKLRTDPELEAQYQQKFKKVMEFVKSTFPYGFRKAENRNSVSRTRFEAIAIGSSLALKQNPDLRPSDVLNWLNGEDFTSIIRSDGANVIAKLSGRINLVKNNLLEVV
jgi:hypothetical protein